MNKFDTNTEWRSIVSLSPDNPIISAIKGSIPAQEALMESYKQAYNNGLKRAADIMKSYRPHCNEHAIKAILDEVEG